MGWVEVTNMSCVLKATTFRWVSLSNCDQIIEAVTKVQNLTIVRMRETEEDKSVAAKEAINSK